LLRSPAHRLIALWASIVLLLNGSVDAFGVHPCPHHDAVAHAPQAASGMAESGHHGAHGHGGAHHAPTPDEPGGHAETCTCLGSCLTGTGAPLPDPPVLPAAPVTRVRPARIAGDVAVLPGRLPYLLPYATAPPVRLS
jgi:hypothetical protein